MFIAYKQMRDARAGAVYKTVLFDLLCCDVITKSQYITLTGDKPDTVDRMLEDMAQRLAAKKEYGL